MQLERRAAAGRHMVYAIGEAEVAHRRRRCRRRRSTVKPRQSATACATVRVPAANGSSSNTPIGPFHSTVAAPAMTSA